MHYGLVMDLVGVPEAAKQLNVVEQRVRQMLAAGVLLGQKLGGVWVVDPVDLRRLVNERRPGGRPLVASSAWDVLRFLDGQPLSGSRLFRAKNHVDRKSIDRLVQCLRSRAQIRYYVAHDGVLQDVGNDGRIVLGGISAASAHNADVINEGKVEGYVKASDLDSLVSDYALTHNAELANMVLRVVDDNGWPFEENQRIASRVVVAVDLLESNNDRSIRAGQKLYEEAV